MSRSPGTTSLSTPITFLEPPGLDQSAHLPVNRPTAAARFHQPSRRRVNRGLLKSIVLNGWQSASWLKENRNGLCLIWTRPAVHPDEQNNVLCVSARCWFGLERPLPVVVRPVQHRTNPKCFLRPPRQNNQRSPSFTSECRCTTCVTPVPGYWLVPMSIASSTVLFPQPFGPTRIVSGVRFSSLPSRMPRKLVISIELIKGQLLAGRCSGTRHKVYSASDPRNGAKLPLETYHEPPTPPSRREIADISPQIASPKSAYRQNGGNLEWNGTVKQAHEFQEIP